MAHREIDLDGRGLAYLLAHLRGVNVLCEGLAREVDRNDARVFTVIPTDADEAHVYQFESGGLLAENLDASRAVPLGPGEGSLMPVASLVDLRASLVLETLKAHRQAVCVCDDFNPRWPSEVVQPSPTAFGVGAETYHLLTEQSGRDMIADTLVWTDAGWHGVAAVCAEGLDVPPRREVTVNALMACAASVIELTCTAYDREGFVVWRRGIG